MNYLLAFDSPGYLLLLALLPLLWWFSLRSLAQLGRARRYIAIGLRTLLLVLLVAALAEIRIVRTSGRLTVFYLLDQSQSIPVQQRQAMIKYVNAEILEHREDNIVGVIVFGRDAAIEIPPFDDDVQLQKQIETAFNREHTNLAGAMKLAQASFPEDAAKRIVILSDGNQNIGDARRQAQGLADSGIGIDVLPIRYNKRAEVVVERLSMPADVRLDQPFDLKVVVNNTSEPTQDDSGEIPGRLIISQIAGDKTFTLSEQNVTLPPGKKVFSIRQEIDSANFYTYEARFVPDNDEDDTMQQNNRATAFTHVRGKGQVLLIEDSRNKSEHDFLIERLRQQGLEVTVRSGGEAFSNLAELQPFDTVLLANVPREQFTDEQITVLVRNTQQMGAGLVMLGGPESMGAGGWTGTELEKAMPVDFQIKSAKIIPRGALVMLMHACEIAEGNHWQKVIAHEAIKTLGNRDYCGIVHWNGTDQWLWGRGLMVVGGNRQQMMAKVDRMIPGDMPEFNPSMKMAQKAFANVPDAAIRHMIIISDGDPLRPSPATMRSLINMTPPVTVSTVAVGSHGPAESRLLARIASQTGGKYYAVRNAKALPRIYQREARRVARPLIWDKHPVQPQVKFPHEMLSGIDGPLPPMRGFVLSSLKNNPLVETSLISPKPTGQGNNTVLASWTYGLGKAVVFASDAGARWTKDWTDTETYDKLFGQMVRWSMRPVDGSGQYTVATDIEDGQVRLVVTALDKDDEFLNFLNMSGSAVGPDMKPVGMEIKQTAPGRYVGTFAARDAGSYFMLISPGPGMAPIRTGINVPYSGEFRDRFADDALLGQLASATPKGGTPGKVIEAGGGPLDENPATIQALLEQNTFRHDLAKATSSRDAWHYLLLCGTCLLFVDVFYRRVHVSFAWVVPVSRRAYELVFRRGERPVDVEVMDRLRSRKAQVGGQIDQLRRETRFEASEETPADLDLDEVAGESSKPATPEKPSLDETGEPESYTERLLRAKKKAWDERKDDS